MRVLNYLMCLLRRGERRRQEIVRILANHPGRQWTEKELCIALHSWVGLIHSDLITLKKRGHVQRHGDEMSGYTYSFRCEPERVYA